MGTKAMDMESRTQRAPEVTGSDFADDVLAIRRLANDRNSLVQESSSSSSAPALRRLTELGIFDVVEEQHLVQKLPECTNLCADDDNCEEDAYHDVGIGSMASSCEALVVAARAAAATGAGMTHAN